MKKYHVYTYATHSQGMYEQLISESGIRVLSVHQRSSDDSWTFGCLGDMVICVAEWEDRNGQAEEEEEWPSENHTRKTKKRTLERRKRESKETAPLNTESPKRVQRDHTTKHRESKDDRP